MRLTRNFAVLALAAFAAMALTAPAASATDPIEVVEADGTTMCPPSPTGCFVHWEGESRLFFHFFGVESTEAICHTEMAGRIFLAGSGFIDSIIVTPGAHDATCGPATMAGCTLPWAFDAEEDVVTDDIEYHVDSCVDPAENNENCSGEYTPSGIESGTEDETQHLEATDLRIGATSFCELTLDLESETA